MRKNYSFVLPFSVCLVSVSSVPLWFVPLLRADPLPGTQPLTFTGDPAAAMVAGLHKYLDRETAAAVERRKQFWKPDFSTTREGFARSIQPNRERLKKVLGVVDQRLPPAMEL